MNPEQFGRSERLILCYESQHQSQSNEKSLVQFDYEKAVLNYLGTQSTFKKLKIDLGLRVNPPRDSSMPEHERHLTVPP